MQTKLTALIAALMLCWLMSACVRVPKGVEPVKNFSADRYLGHWYEISRLDHSFERGLTQVSATYSKREDGGIRVINRGFSPKENKWKSVEGKAYFVNKTNEGYLKVSFWGPFYGSYVILDLDEKDYQYSLVCGPTKSYFWILCRTPQMDPALKQRLVARAAALGFDTTKLISVEQAPSPP